MQGNGQPGIGEPWVALGDGIQTMVGYRATHSVAHTGDGQPAKTQRGATAQNLAAGSQAVRLPDDAVRHVNNPYAVSGNAVGLAA